MENISSKQAACAQNRLIAPETIVSRIKNVPPVPKRRKSKENISEKIREAEQREI